VVTPHDDTIAAIATPLGEGALAVIRVSGRDALTVADRCFRPAGRRAVTPSAAASHTLHLGQVVRDGRVVDEVLLAVMRAPRTYTREDVVEISCHGGVLPAKLVLEAVLAAGARLAEPGEFTKRAFLNGRLDLAQAEAVADIIRARTDLALAVAEEQLAGRLSQRINRLRDDLMHVLAHVEAHIDFPEEDIAPETQSQLRARLLATTSFLDELLRTAAEGQILRQGVRAAIVGRPNVGKSSLLNQLLGHDRAIVAPTPGTTRDTIEESANIRGLPVVFVDTAGLRDAGEAVEQEGIRRSQAALRSAELVLLVLDRSEPLQPEDERLLADLAGRKHLVVLNKSDLPPRLELSVEVAVPAVPVSCLSGEGLEPLKDAIQRRVWSGALRTERIEAMINARHQDALRRTREAASRAIAALEGGAPLDLVAFDLRLAVNAVGEVVGKTAVDDLLDRVFREFCLGK
jgi:tRNA modification GTPase